MEREKLNEKCRLLAMEIDNTRECYDQKRWVVNCLLKKHARDVTPIYAQLVYSSIVAKIVREAVKAHNETCERIYLTSEERKALHIWCADTILEEYEEKTGTNVTRTAL